MTTSPDESNEPAGTSGPGISDEQLPEDLQPTDDNPLAQDPKDPDDQDDNRDDNRDDGQPEGEPPGAVPGAPNG